ncbi:enoyl-CoA hydratase-related protein [Chloroflexota bacterium]
MSAKLGITPAKLGVTYPASGLRNFMNLVGISSTKELFFTGRLIDAARAREINLVDYIFSANDLLYETRKFANEMESNAPLSIASIKNTISKLAVNPDLDITDKEEIHQIAIKALQSEDTQEGQRAFFEKRKSHFTGK